jgi:glycosyltransferase involved in cell wall biosynthesis
MVSIVVCTYNDSNYLPRALKSCIIQNIEKEIILVDDCSTDPMNPEVLRLLEDHKDLITYIKHPVNSGLSASRNTGISASRYDYVIPLDADDFLFPRSIRTLIHFVSEYYDIFYGFMTSSGKVCHPYTRDITKDILLEKNPIFCSSIFRKSIWEKVGGYKVRAGPHYEDWNFWCKCFIAGAKFKYVPTLVYEHTERPDSMLRILGLNKEKYVTLATEELRDTI